MKFVLIHFLIVCLSLTTSAKAEPNSANIETTLPDCSAITSGVYNAQACKAATFEWLRMCFDENIYAPNVIQICSLEPKIDACKKSDVLSLISCHETISSSWNQVIASEVDRTIALLKAPNVYQGNLKLDHFEKAQNAFEAFKSAECAWKTARSLPGRERDTQNLICKWRKDAERAVTLADERAYIR